MHSLHLKVFVEDLIYIFFKEDYLALEVPFSRVWRAPPCGQIGYCIQRLGLVKQIQKKRDFFFYDDDVLRTTL